MDPTFAVNEPLRVASTSVPDLFWYISTSSTVLLVGLLTYMGKRGLNKLDSIKDELIAIKVNGARVEQKLTDHIENKAIHCKRAQCLVEMK